ncbi:MAG: PAS domain S-box protein [Gallionellaceae bacterium]|jgi:PAS domain S-box-containing protein
MYPKDLVTEVAPSRLTSQIIAGVLLVNLFMTLLVGFILYQSYRQHQLIAESMTQSLAHVLENNLTGTFDQVDIAMLTVTDEASRQLVSGNFNAAAINAVLKLQQKRLPAIDSLRIADRNGIVKYGPGVPPGSRVDINDRQYYQLARTQKELKAVVGEPIFSRINKKWELPVARRINFPDGKFAGIVYAFISLEKISREFSHLNVGAKGVVNLRDVNFRIIARYPEAGGFGTEIGKNTLSPALQKLLQAQPETGTYRIHSLLDNEDRTYSYRRLSAQPLYVAVAFAAEEYLAEWHYFFNQLSVMLVIFMLLSASAAWLVIRGEVRRREAGQALHVLNRDFLTLLESTSDFIYFKDQDSRIRFCSQTMAKITGHQHWREMVGKNDLEIFPADTAKIYHDEELPVFRDGTPILNRIDPYYDEQGKQGWVSTNKWPVFGDDGETVIGLFGISRDISEFKRAELALHDTMKSLNEAQRIAKVGNWELDLLTNKLHWSDEIFRLFEIDPSKFSATYDAFLHAIHPEDRDAVNRAYIRSLETRQPYEIVHRLLMADGRIKWVSEHCETFYDAQDKALRSVGTVQDITERKLIEARLVESESFLRTVIDNEPECIKILDEQGRLLQMNAAGLAMIEADSLEQVAGNSLLNVIAPEYREAFDKMHQQVIAGEVQQLKFEVLGLRGGRRMLETHAVPMRDHGKIVHLAVTRDITEQQKAEDALQRSNADLERFAYSVSHDMRQPLRAISGHLQLLQRSLQDKLDDDERENLGFALEGAKRMDSMIVSLLDYSRVGRKTEAKQWLPSRVPLDDALSFLAPMIGETHAEIKQNGEWPQIFGSRDELTRLFQNLIGNAIKFRDTGQAALVELDSLVEGSTWRVSVRDHGVGIDPQQIDRLFHFFSRLQSRTRFEGTGMGLALCRRIVEHHGGRIWVESEGAGKGSVFIFELPMLVGE